MSLNMQLKKIAGWFALVGFLLFANVSYAKKLNLQLKKVQSTILVHTIFLQETITYSISEKTEILSKLEYVYRVLNHQESKTHGLKPYNDNKESLSDQYKLAALLNELGEYFFTPIQSAIDKALEIEFIISEDLIRCPFDVLYYKGLPLFLQKPVTYSFEMQEDNPFFISKAWDGLMISDVTADPERGVLIAKNLFPRSQYFDIHDITVKHIKEFSKIDLILISGHGIVTDRGDDFIALQNEKIIPQIFLHASPQLVYLDSCQLGISLDFIRHFRRNKTKYYIAPILSNEAGDSSTKTIEWFFKFLARGETPSYALFKTRQELYELFKKYNAISSQNDFVELMWRVFPFRVYHLN